MFCGRKLQYAGTVVEALEGWGRTNDGGGRAGRRGGGAAGFITTDTAAAACARTAHCTEKTRRSRTSLASTWMVSPACFIVCSSLWRFAHGVYTTRHEASLHPSIELFLTSWHMSSIVASGMRSR